MVCGARGRDRTKVGGLEDGIVSPWNSCADSGHSLNLSLPCQAVRGEICDIIIIGSFPLGEGEVIGDSICMEKELSPVAEFTLPQVKVLC